MNTENVEEMIRQKRLVLFGYIDSLPLYAQQSSTEKKRYSSSAKEVQPVGSQPEHIQERIWKRYTHR